jgi:Sulfotransferase family
MGAFASSALPNFLVIGAQKSGTTALYYHLRSHPQVFMSPVKEPQFFASDLAGPSAGPGDRASYRFQDIDAYRGLFSGVRGEAAVGEASVSYLYSSVAARRIAETIPDARLIAVLRNPVDRAHSNYLHLVRDGREPCRDFAAALAAEDDRRRQGWSANWHYRAKGYYGRQIARYLDVFPRERLRVYLYDDFEERPRVVLDDIARFLAVEPAFDQDLSLRLNVAGIPRRARLYGLLRRMERLKWAANAVAPAAVRRRALAWQNRTLDRPEVPPGLRRELMAGYRDDLALLEDRTGLDVSRWTERAADG